MKLAPGLLLGAVVTAAWAGPAGTDSVQQIGMVADEWGTVLVFDTDPPSVLAGIPIANNGSGAGDCTIAPDGRLGYVKDGQGHVWVIDLALSPPALAAGTNPIAISGPGTDLAATADGRFLVVCNAGFVNLLSVVDTVSRAESSTFDLGSTCRSVDVCANGSVLITTGEIVRRLVIDATGHLSSTGQQFTSDAINVYCSPNSAAGVAMSQNGHLRSFRTAGMLPVSDRDRPAYGSSGAVAQDGMRFYGRSFDAVDAYDFDQATGELGAAPVFSAGVGSWGYFNFGGADQFAIDYAGAAVYTPERFQLSINDAVTGAALPPLAMPDLLFSGGMCFGPQPAFVCNPAACNDANPCTDDTCDESGCVHIPDDTNRCGDRESCLATYACSAGTCVAGPPADCHATCPPGYDDTTSPILDVCQKTYGLDASRLDNLDDSCDATGTNRYNCEGESYGFHWIDTGGAGVGPVNGIDLWIIAGRNCEEGRSPLTFNGVPLPYGSIEGPVDCSCSPVHTPIRFFPNPALYVKGGLNTITIAPTGTCEGLSTGSIIGGLYARVSVSYAPLDQNCFESACNAATNRCEYTVQTCDDGNPCTDDTCDQNGGCIFVPVAEYTPCDDGNICNGHEYCHEDSVCYADYPTSCYGDGNACTWDRCDPAVGCVYEPIDCDDHDPCTDDSCDYVTGCVHVAAASEPNPRTHGYYKGLCQGPHSGDQLNDADAVCVASVASAFAGIATVGDLCAELQPSQPNSDPCDRADDELMTLALNVCRARVCVAQSIDSHCGANTTVGQSLSESNALLASPSRDATTCNQAKCLDQEINNGSALELDTLTLSLEGSDVRLTWLPPLTGSGTTVTYHVWRRSAGSLAPFTMIGQISGLTYVDATSGGGAYEYEITAATN